MGWNNIPGKRKHMSKTEMEKCNVYFGKCQWNSLAETQGSHRGCLGLNLVVDRYSMKVWKPKAGLPKTGHNGM